MATERDNAGLEADIGITLGKLTRQLASAEARMVKTAKKYETDFANSNRKVSRGFEQTRKSATGSTTAIGREMDRLRVKQDMLGGSARTNRAALQNVSFQLQDIFTQVTMGTPVMRSLSVQLPQLLGGFGALGAAVGVAVGALGLFTPSTNKAKDAAKDLGDELDTAYEKAKGALEAAKEAQDRYSAAIALTGAAQSQVTPEILGNLKLEAQAREALARLEVARMERAKKALEASIPPLQERIRLIGEQVRAEMSAGTGSGSAQERAAAERRIAEETQKRLDAAYELTGELREQQAELDLINSQLGLNNGEASEFIDNLLKANEGAKNTAGAISTINFSGAIEGAIELSRTLGVSLHQAMQIMGLVGAAANAARAKAEKEAVIFDPRDPNYDPIRAEMARVSESAGNTSPFDPSRIKTPKATSTSKAGSKGGSGGASDPLANLLKEIALNERLLGMSEARAQIMRRLGDDASKYSETELNGVVQRIQAYEQERQALEGIQAQQNAVAATLEGAMTDAVMSAIEDFDNLGDAAKAMARNVIAELTRILVVQRMVGSFDSKTGSGSGIVGAIMGAFGGSKAPSFAGGGYTGSGARTGGLDGKGGFPAVLHPNETVIDHSKGGGGATTQITQYIDVTGADAAAIQRMEVALQRANAELPGRIISTVKDASRRGAIK